MLILGAIWFGSETPSQFSRFVDNVSSEVHQVIGSGEDHHNYVTSPVTKTFDYCIRGQRGEISITLYGGVVDHMEFISRSVYAGQEDEYWEIMVKRLIDDEVQDKYLTALVETIRNVASNPDDQLRIAVSMVQLIPYDWDSYYSVSSYMKSPYEVLYYDKGVCAEKSFLLAYLLKKLGYGVLLLEYEEENHMAVAVACPAQYANIEYGNRGYCFIESTRPTIITYVPDTYLGVGELKSTPHVVAVSDGKEFVGVGEEYRDAKEYGRLTELADSNNNVLPQAEYQRWRYLVNKYCLLDN